MSYLTFQQETRGVPGLRARFSFLKTKRGEPLVIQAGETHRLGNGGKPVLEIEYRRNHQVVIYLAGETASLTLDFGDIMNTIGREWTDLDVNTPSKALFRPESIGIQRGPLNRQLVLIREDKLPLLMDKGIAISPRVISTWEPEQPRPRYLPT